MNERGRMLQIIQRYREADRLLPEKKAALSKAVERVIKKYNLTPESGMSLLNELSTPPDWVNQREHRIHFGLEVKKRGPLPELSKDDAAKLYKFSKWRLKKLASGEIVGEGMLPSDARWETLSYNERDTVRKMKKRFSTQHNAFHKGKPTYDYTLLIEEYIEIIERAVCNEFSFSREVTCDENDYEASGPPCGPMMEALMSALDLASPYSGLPPRETVAGIVKEKRRKNTT